MFASLCMALFAGNDTLRSAGMGKTYRSAVNEALVLALEQHEGVTVSAVERASMNESNSSLTENDNGLLDETGKLAMNDSLSKEMKKWANGKIQSFTVLEDFYDPSTKIYRVTLDVVFPSDSYIVGRDYNNLRRMVVVPFRPTGTTFTWHGQTYGTLDWSMALADKLNINLTQTRKFTVLDRKFDTEINAELALLDAKNASKADAVKMCKKLGTDYLVVGEVSLSNVASPGYHPVTGQELDPTSALFAEITYRVLIAPTSQLKWTDTVRLDSLDFASCTDLKSFVSATAEAAATAISDGLMANILPFEIAAITPNGSIVIGEGGKSLVVGEMLTVYALGEEVYDSRTGEMIDVIEEPVGTVVVTKVDAKLSYAKVVEGDVSQMKKEMRLRRTNSPEVETPAPATVQPPTGVYQLPNNGVIVPF